MAQNMLVMSGSYNNFNFDMPIHIHNALVSEKEIEDHIIYAFPNGNVVWLKDVATVERQYQKANKNVNYNGKNAIVISVEMRKGNNIVSFGKKVEKVLQKFSEDLPESVHMYRITDQPQVVSKSVTSFLRDLFISMAVVILVMMMLC